MPEITKLLAAYHAAGRALDRAMHRAGGATGAEWQAEEDARIELRAARRAYVDDVRAMIDESDSNRRRVDAGDYH